MEQVMELEAGWMLETDDAGSLVIPAELLGHPGPFTRFVVERTGTVFVIQREAEAETEAAQEIDQKPTLEEWQRQWKAAQEQVSKSWPAGVSAADVISEIRR